MFCTVFFREKPTAHALMGLEFILQRNDSMTVMQYISPVSELVSVLSDGRNTVRGLQSDGAQVLCRSSTWPSALLQTPQRQSRRASETKGPNPLFGKHPSLGHGEGDHEDIPKERPS